jgi:hypothetical protein
VEYVFKGGWYSLKRLVALLLALRLTSFGASYFVTQSGAGTGTGSSPGNAWSLASYNASSKATGGDTVFFSGTFTSTVAIGTSGTGNGVGRLTLDFTAATLNSANPRIQIGSNSYLSVNGGSMGKATSGTLINFAGDPSNISHDVTIQNWTHVGDPASSACFVTPEYCYNCVVQSNYIDNCSLLWCDSTLNHDDQILNNFNRTTQNPTQADIDIDCIDVGDMANMIIEGNYLENRAYSTSNEGHQDVIQCYTKGGSNSGSPTGWVIAYNKIVMNDSNGGSGDNSLFMMQGMDGVPHAGYSKPPLRCFSNVFLIPSTATTGNNGIVVTRNKGGNYYFYNNTIIRHGSTGNIIRFEDAGTLYAENNVAESDSPGGTTGVSWSMKKGVWDYNYFYNFPSESTLYSGPHGSITADPLFNNYAGNDFSTQSNSPLRNAGDSTIGATYNRGLAFGASWPLSARGLVPPLARRLAGAWDIGAYQSSTSLPRATLTPPPPQKPYTVPAASP